MILNNLQVFSMYFIWLCSAVMTSEYILPEVLKEHKCLYENNFSTNDFSKRLINMQCSQIVSRKECCCDTLFFILEHLSYSVFFFFSTLGHLKTLNCLEYCKHSVIAHNWNEDSSVCCLVSLVIVYLCALKVLLSS